MEYEHNGIKINLDEDGMFSAFVAGKIQTVASLVVMKKRIDAVCAFMPFKAYGEFIEFEAYNLREVTVVGIKRPLGRVTQWNKNKWQSDDGLSYKNIVPFTPEARKHFYDLQDMREAFGAEIDALLRKRDAALEKQGKLVCYVVMPQ